MLFLLALLLPASSWAANPCAPMSAGPCTASDLQKNKILDSIRAAQAANNEGNKAFDAWEKTNPNNKEGLLAALDAVVFFDKKMRESYNEAIRLTEEAYHIALPSTEGAIAKPRDPHGLGDWAMGVKATWAPRFYSSDHQYLQVKGSDYEKTKELHYLGGPIGRDIGGRTYGDGTVIITGRMFEKAVEAGNPGILAYAIHHEANHFTELLARGWDSLEEGEMRAYKKSLAAADAFELDKITIDATGKTVKDFIKDKIKENSKALSSGQRTSPYPDAETEKANENGFLEDKERDANFEKMLARLRQDVADERRVKEEARRRQEEEAQKRTLDLYLGWARWFGFEPVIDKNGQSSGFGAQYRCDYEFTSAMDLEEAVMSLFFASACLDRGFPENYEKDLTNTIDLINQRWSNPDFRSKLGLFANSGPQEDCLRYMRDNMRAPFDFQRVNRETTRFWKAWDKGALRRLNEYERKKRRQQEDQDRQQRGGNNGNEREDDRGCAAPNSRTGIIGCPAPHPR